MLVWNRYGEVEYLADKFEAAGGTVLVAENGYINPGGGTAKYDVYEGVESWHQYALAIHGHNGSGQIPIGGIDRLENLKLNLSPFRKTQPDGSSHVLVCPGRNFGSRKLIPSVDWVKEIVPQLQREFPKSEIRVRHHPGNGRPGRELHEDLEGCSLCVIWASTSGVHALVAGIPVRCLSPYWICKYDGEWDDQSRSAVLNKMAWAQYSVEEIATGLAFRYLLPKEVSNWTTSTR